MEYITFRYNSFGFENNLVYYAGLVVEEDSMIDSVPLRIGKFMFSNGYYSGRFFYSNHSLPKKAS